MRNKFDVDENLDTPFDIRHLKRVGVYLKRYKRKMIISLLLSALAIVVGLLGPFITKYAIDTVIPAKDYGMLVLLAAALLATIIVSIVFTKKRAVLMTEVSQDVIFDIRTDLYKHLQELPFEYYDSRPHGKILVRVINYVNSVSDFLSNGIINFILELFSLIFILVFMFVMDWQMALVIMTGVPVLAVIVLSIKNKQRKSWQQVSNKNSNLNAYLHEGLEGVKVTQMFAREEVNNEIFEKLSDKSRKTWLYAVIWNNILWPATDTIAISISALIYIAGLLIFPGVSFGTIVGMGGYASRFWQPIMNIANLYNNFINTVAYLERIFELLDEPVAVKDKDGAVELGAIKGDLSFDNVTFSYDESAVILENLSFNIKQGESVALVGPTGAGKSTIVNLISRFYNVNSGRVLIDNTDIADVTLHSLRSQMGIMLQDSFVFTGTVRENIRYGKLNATDEEIYKAAKIVCADEFIRKFPDGYETMITERGTALSQGQRQLITFARTLVSDPKILILDEATSSIDAKTERDLQTALAHVLKGRTSFIIAHRLSTIRNCDKIMYVSNRGITECGTHDELIAKHGDYYDLYNARSTKTVKSA
ncbi:MAG: ABC transporter ATP-binding protein/permease [Ruminococcus sp.]|jgi:ATP-binding cassette subfamily B protein|nr:ABC transporter ATP-binding protein/permease [Ruminococcus sp.]